jgi:hypothetical protein
MISYRRGAFVIVAIGLLTHGPVSPASAATPIGDTQQVVSEVQGFLGPVTRVLQLQDEVFSEEIIDTGGDGATRILFLDETALTMGPNSRVTLDRFVYDPAAGDGAMLVNFVSGVFEFASGLMPSGGYDLRTPFANLAIRGTRVRLLIGQNEFMIAVPEGAVEVDDGNRTVLLNSEFECFVWNVEGGGQLLPLEACAALMDGIAATYALLGLGPIEPGAGPPPAPPAFPPIQTPRAERTSFPLPDSVSPSSGQSLR